MTYIPSTVPGHGKELFAALFDEFGDLKTQRLAWERRWREITDYCAPTRDCFGEASKPPRPCDIFDGTAILAAENLAAGLQGLLADPGHNWFALGPHKAALAEEPQVRIYFEEVAEIIRYTLLADGKGFYAQAPDFFRDLIAFGTALFYVEARYDSKSNYVGLRFSARPLSELYIAANDCGGIERLYRPFALSAPEAYARYGEVLPSAIRRAAEQDRGAGRYDFLRVLVQNPSPEPRLACAEAKPWLCYTFACDTGALVQLAGFSELPYQVARWSLRAGSAYGTSQAMLAMPDIRTLNAMAKTTLIAAQKAVDPPILAQQEMGLSGLKTHPGAIIPGGLDAMGQRQFEPFTTGADIGLSLEMEQQRRDAIREAFLHASLVQIAQNNMSATEYLGRQSEKARLLAPYLGRIRAEFLDPLLRRVYALLERAGQLPERPQILQDAILQDAGAFQVSYLSPMSRTAKMLEAGAVMKSMDSLRPLMEHNPMLISQFDLPAATRLIAEAFGVPSTLMRG